MPEIGGIVGGGDEGNLLARTADVMLLRSLPEARAETPGRVALAVKLVEVMLSLVTGGSAIACVEIPEVERRGD